MSTLDVKTISIAAARGSFADYIELMKLRLSSLVLVTTAVGFCLGFTGPIDLSFYIALSHVIFGTTLVAAGAMVLNQYIERDTDALMRRTMDRPIPAGRVSASDAMLFGIILAVVGLVYLFAIVNLIAGGLAFLTLTSYLFAYTPLKTRTPLCTIVGAIPGAIPPMLGYAASAGVMDRHAWTLFAILFIWQMPHFLAIAWLYREDYARGRQLMLPVVDPTGTSTARQVISFSLTLLPITLMPTVFGMAGMIYFAAAVLLGVVFLAFAFLTAVRRTESSARKLFLASVLYLPLLLALLVFDRAPF
jgi:protoheme IX farnesyltransferase